MIVESKNLEVSYKKGKIKAVKGLSFKVGKGEVFIFIGPDGAGKSSTLKATCGVVNYSGGRLRVFGKDPKEEKEFNKVREKISFMPQGLGRNLYKKLSVEENIDFFASLYGVEGKERERRKELLLKATGLWQFKERQAGKLSGGMMQKLGICCALIHKPQLLVLDEPTTGVDPLSRRELWKLIYGYVKEGITVMVATSYLDEAERGSRVLLMKDGKGLAQGEPEKVARTKKPVLVITGKDYLKAYEKLWEISNSVRIRGKKVKVVEDREKVEEVLKGLQVKIEETEAEIEDFFIEKVGLKKVELPQSFKSKVEVPEEAVIVDKVVKAFGDFKAVKGVSFKVKRGEIFGILGPNGAGKTTLIKTILGLYKPTEGQLVVAGKRKRNEIKEIIGYMSQRFSLYEDLTVKENLNLWGTLYGVSLKEIKEKVEETAPVLGLKEYEEKLVRELPLGIKQRVSLLSALLHSPAILFLDEPTSGVDPAEREIFWQVIRELSRKFGTTVLTTTHYLDEAEYCDRLLLMNRGEVIALGNPQELKEKVKGEVGKVYLIYTPSPFETIERLKELGLIAFMYGRKVKVFLKEGEVEQILKKAGIKEFKVKEGEITMEDVFIYEVEKSSRDS